MILWRTWIFRSRPTVYIIWNKQYCTFLNEILHKNIVYSLCYFLLGPPDTYHVFYITMFEIIKIGGLQSCSTFQIKLLLPMCKMCSMIHNTTPKTTQQHNNLHSVMFARQVCSWQRSQRDKCVLMCSLVHGVSGKISCKNRPGRVRRENMLRLSTLVLLHLQPTFVFYVLFRPTKSTKKH